MPTQVDSRYASILPVVAGNPALDGIASARAVGTGRAQQIAGVLRDEDSPSACGELFRLSRAEKAKRGHSPGSQGIHLQGKRGAVDRSRASRKELAAARDPPRGRAQDAACAQKAVAGSGP